MYIIPLAHVPELGKILFKRGSHQVVSVSCYLEALVESFLRLQVLVFVNILWLGLFVHKKDPLGEGDIIIRTKPHNMGVKVS